MRIIVSPPNQITSTINSTVLPQSPKLHQNLVNLTRAISERDH
ncbi:hypothetical protein GBLP1_g0932 [Lactiplantibacillus plantarum]|nr:hypothetical protein GBLP1_g0932 [Lactiplantibacillus plantarum]